MNPLWRTLTVITAVGAATAGGVFFTFSAFVMPALRRLPAAQGIAAMQSINVTAVRAPLMILLFGTAAASVALGIHAVFNLGDRREVFILAAAVIYVVGCIIMTAGFHVPRNDALAKLDPNAASSVSQWRTYLTAWTAGNHVRAAAGIIAATLYIIALVSPRTDTTALAGDGPSRALAAWVR
ncbi:anthrone oxygenase family protein [Jatrophihabitans sp. DSM 45814]